MVYRCRYLKCKYRLITNVRIYTCIWILFIYSNSHMLLYRYVPYFQTYTCLSYIYIFTYIRISITIYCIWYLWLCSHFQVGPAPNTLHHELYCTTLNPYLSLTPCLIQRLFEVQVFIYSHPHYDGTSAQMCQFRPVFSTLSNHAH